MRRLFAIVVVLLAPHAWGAEVTADQQAQALFDTDWQWRMQHQPEFATTVGDYRYNATLSDTSLAASHGAILHEHKMLEQARRIERDRLSADHRLSWELFVREKEHKLAAADFYLYRVQPVTAQDGIHIGFAQLVAQMPFATETDYRSYLSRIDALPCHIDGLIEQMREGMRSGWVAPKVTVRAVPAMLRELRENLVPGPLGAPFRQIPATIPKPVRDALAAAGPAALLARAAPALQKLEEFMSGEYLPAARESIAAASLPGGAAYYAFTVKANTGVELAPAEIHALGVSEVARIQSDMRAAIAETGFSGTLKQFIAFANSDPRLFYTTPEQLLTRYRAIIARAGERLPALFAALPTQQIVVKPLAATGAAHMAAAYYEAGAPDRPAAFIVNTARLATRPLWEMETLALHEAVPGHHLQTARAHQLPDLPNFRRYGWHVAFGEGWAMYAESLGPELGLFRSPFSRFGHLNSELLRAARLVVDTGIHAMGWSRRQAIDYLDANTANPAPDNEVEVDRYIANPGQALGYKIGQLKIKALRDKAQAALGDRFDIRLFHNAVIDHGPMPLAMLEQQIERWIARMERDPKI